MANGLGFQYAGLDQGGASPYQSFEPPQAKPQQQPGGGMPMAGLQQFTATPAAAPAAGAEAGGASAAGGGSGGGSGMAAGGWFAALAAVIIANENAAKEGGYRDEKNSDHMQDLIGGKVLEQDVEKRWVPKFFGDDDYGFGGDTKIASNLLTGDFSNAWDQFKNEGTFSKVLDIF